MTTYDENGNEIKVDANTNKARKAAFEQMSKKVILVDLSCKQISNLPFDIVLSDKLAKKMNVKDTSIVQVRKLLFNPQHLSKIRGLINDAMLMVWNHTRPWDNIGYRLLPMEYYDDFIETFSKIKDEFEEAVNEFINNYDDYVKDSKIQLGDCYNENDYPDKSQLSSFFELEIKTMSLPDIDDIRLNISGPELMEMQKCITDNYTDTIKESLYDLVNIMEFEKDCNKDMANKILARIEKLNIIDDHEIDMRLAELKDKLDYNAPEEKVTSKSDMMLMDDLDDLNDLENDDLI